MATSISNLELVFGFAVQGRHGARPGEELVAEPIEMRLDLCRRQRRRPVLFHVHHVLAAHAEPDNHMSPVLLDEPVSCPEDPEFHNMSVYHLLQLGLICKGSVSVVVPSMSEDNASA
jgi:hypothetical protein